MLTASSIPTPMVSSSKLSTYEAPYFDDSSLYISIVGGLQYITITIPDLAFVVNKVCQDMHCTKEPHFKAVN
jgi:hypothetical protein